MKSSGIEWIGEIPNSWELRKVKQCFYISKEQAHEENPTILSLARAGVKIRDISNNEGQLAASYDNYNPVLPGDLLLNPMDLYSGANCSISEVSGVISPAYINLRKKVDLNPKFYDYYFKTQYWAMAMFAHGKGVSFDNRWTMNAETILNYYLPFPSNEEQQKIVDFLNKKILEIDSLIEIENQQIEVLYNYKEGLNESIFDSTVMQSTNLWYCPFIPDNWSVKKLSSIFQMISGYPYQSNTFTNEDTGFQVLRLGNVKNDKLLLNEKMIFVKEKFFPFNSSTIIRKNDILLTMTGTRLKRDYFYTVCVEKDYDNLGINQRVGIFRVTENKLFHPKFFSYLFKTKEIKDAVFSYETGTANQGNIGFNNLGGIKLPFPEYSKQIEIAEMLDKKNEAIDALIEVKIKKIEKLEDYKKTLIYEYVTGKKEVC